jgi:hypothetical protein
MDLPPPQPPISLLLEAEPQVEAPGSDRPERLGGPSLDLALGLGVMAPTERPVLGLLLAWVSWGGVYGSLDLRFARLGPAQLGLGIEGFYNRALLLEAAGEWVLGLSGADFDITPHHFGGHGAFSAAFRPDQVFQPYAVALLGTDRLSIDIAYVGASSSGSGHYAESALRLGGGLGAAWVTDRGLRVGLEGRYLWARSFQTESSVAITDADGEELVTWEQQSWQKPPRGMGLVLDLGWRI